MALVYVTRSYFTTDSIYSAPYVVNDGAELDRVLERAERDVDGYVGPWSRDVSSGRKFGDLTANPVGLTATQVTAVKEAVCAQALWRIGAGEGQFINSQYQSVSGPDFATTGQRSRISPQAKALLTDAGLVVRTARLA